MRAMRSLVELTLANTPLRAGDQLGESGLNVWVGNWPFNLRRVPVKGIDFLRADIAHE